MNAHGPVPGHHHAGPGKNIRWPLAMLGHRLLDMIDAGLSTGVIDVHLPDGSMRILGGRGAGPACVVDIRAWRALGRMIWSGSVGWYEAWVADEWRCAEPAVLFEIFVRNRATLDGLAQAKGFSRLVKRARHALNRNDRTGAKRNIVAHYDLGNDFYSVWLDETMSYSSAIWAAGDDLVTAQRRKQAAVLDRLNLTPRSTMLEIGCGWGSLAAAAYARGAHVTAISLSPSQLSYARAHHSPGIVFEARDYRDVNGTYDAIASVEMVEAVGERYWPAYLDSITRALKPGGRAALQFIAISGDGFDAYRANADFIQTYIFPGGMLLSEGRFRMLAEARGLEWADRRGLAIDYADTLGIWRAQFEAAVLPAHFDQKFVDLWRYYLMYCEGGFRGGGIDVVQVTLIKPDNTAASANVARN